MAGREYVRQLIVHVLELHIPLIRFAKIPPAADVADVEILREFRQRLPENAIEDLRAGAPPLRVSAACLSKSAYPPALRHFHRAETPGPEVPCALPFLIKTGCGFGKTVADLFCKRYGSLFASPG
jgi:hypothetical protein